MPKLETAKQSTSTTNAEDFLDCDLSLIKPEPINEEYGVSDPLLLTYDSAINIKKEPSSKFFGRVELEIDDNGARSYKFICDKCTNSFSSLESFDEHISKNYLNATQAPLSGQNETLAANVVDKVEIPNERPVVNTTKESVEADKSDLDDFEPESESESYEPKAKRTKRLRSKTLSFDYPDKNCITFFLELLKTHAILWLKRHSGQIKPFAEATTDFLTEFNTKYSDYNMTKIKLQRCVDHIKSSYERASGNEILQTKYNDFLKLCAEVEENSKQIEKKCDQCKAVYYKQVELQTHKYKIHNVGELPFKCQRCGYGFACAEKLASHAEKHERVKTFKCEICGSAFYVESKLAAHHTQMHSEDRKRICEICGAVCADPARYRDHKKTHEPKKEKCEICNKTFLRNWELVDHMKAHENERTYICNLCGKGFNRQKNLYIHKRCVHKMKATKSTQGKIVQKTISEDDDTDSSNEMNSQYISFDVLNTILS